MLRLKILLQYKSIYIIILITAILFSIINNINNDYKNINSSFYEGTITDIEEYDDKVVFILKGRQNLRCTYKGNIKLKLGIKIKVSGNIKTPSNNTIPNTFNYKKYLEHKSIFVMMDVNKLTIINNKENILYFIKNKLLKYLNTFKNKAYMKMFIIGYKKDMNDEVINNYQELGVSHIFAISGMHVSILTMIIFNILKKFRIKENYIYYMIIIFLLFYIFITSYQASVLRSVGLYILLFINKRFSLNIETINIFLLDISILLFINYNLLFDLGFEYSSIVTYSLIKYNYLIKGNYIIKLIIISLIANTFSIPITLYNNYEINILSIINNIFFVPFISLIFYPCILISFIFKPFENILTILIRFLELISKHLLTLNIVVPKINMFYIIVYYLLIYIFFNTFKKRYLIIILLMTIIYMNKSIFDNNLYVYYLDVNQGDASVVKYKNKTIMIDTGSFKNEYISRNIVVFLKSLGINKIDYLILSHGDEDHAGATSYLINNIKIDKIILNKGSINDIEKKIIENKKVNIYKDINNINDLGLNINFLNTKEYDDENNNSNVIYFEYKKYKFLFMGDAGIEKEKDILSRYDLNNIDFLKVGHHGSDTSSNKYFIDTITPKFSLISVGKNNRYGHPKEEVLEILKNSEIYRTDLDGSIEIKLNKRGYKISTCPP